MLNEYTINENVCSLVYYIFYSVEKILYKLKAKFTFLHSNFKSENSVLLVGCRYCILRLE